MEEEQKEQDCEEEEQDCEEKEEEQCYITHLGAANLAKVLWIFNMSGLGSIEGLKTHFQPKFAFDGKKSGQNIYNTV